MNYNALMITQYERYGTVGRDEYIENFIHEELSVDISMLSDYNEYLLNNNNGDDYIYDDLETMLSGFSTMEIVRATHFGNFNYSDDYYVFNGYGNIDSMTDYEVIKKMENDTDFLKWYIEENDLINWDDADKDIEDANELIKKGYWYNIPPATAGILKTRR